MKITQMMWKKASGWREIGGTAEQPKAEQVNLVLAFGSRDILTDDQHYHDLKKRYPKAHIVMGSTAGEITNSQVTDDTLSSTAITFKHTQIEVLSLKIQEAKESENIGKKLGESLPHKDLTYVYLITDGQNVNGTQLLNGLNQSLPKGVVVTGGLAGDGSRFVKTLVGLNSPPSEGQVVAIGFYGNRLKIGFGSVGGWDPFGPVRKITRSEGNVLYELDNQPALTLYKKYLGDQAKDLPGSGLLFPLNLYLPDRSNTLVRTILAIDEKTNSLTFAGDIPVGYQAQLMKANFDRLIEGAENAAVNAHSMIRNTPAELAILISCVGRKLVLGPRIDEEVEGVRRILGEKPVITGFYSYGELCPMTNDSPCELHNQTMTIATLYENE